MYGKFVQNSGNKTPNYKRHIWIPGCGLKVYIIINCKAWDGMVWRGFIRLIIGAVTVYPQYGNEPLDSM
jgi:hypothetical protein